MDFIGQKLIIEDFKKIIHDNTLSHAYVLTGTVGMGKRTVARYLAEMLLCTGEERAAPCGRCMSCRSFEGGTNPNFTAIKNETQKILIRQIRGIIDNIGVRPASGRKVYVIEDADHMTPDAQNCLLKTLEEPPGYAVIILTTAVYESLLITVRSRAVQIRLKPYSIEELKAIALKNGTEISGKEHLLSWSQGIPGRAIQLLGDKKFEENREKAMDFVFHDDELSRLRFNKYLSGSKEVFNECMDILESLYRDALMVLCGADDGLINSDKKIKIIGYIEKKSPEELIEKIDKINGIRNSLKRNMNYQLAVDMVTLNV